MIAASEQYTTKTLQITTKHDTFTTPEQQPPIFNKIR